MIFAAALLNFMSIVIPPYIGNTSLLNQSSTMFEYVFNAVEKANIPETIGLTIIVSFGFSCLVPHMWIVIGLSPVYIIIFIMSVEIMFYPTSHNLLPIEILVYLVLSMPSIIAALLGSRIRMHLNKQEGTTTKNIVG